MFEVKSKANFTKYMDKLKSYQDLSAVPAILEKYGEKGVAMLAEATPIDTGVTADSWYYTIEEPAVGSFSLVFRNSNMNEGIPVVILLEYGHVTKNGGYVPANDFMSKVVDSIFNDMSEEIIKEVRGS